jgi:uncharacterized protein YwgA
MSPYCPYCQEIVDPFYHLVDDDEDFAGEYKRQYHLTGGKMDQLSLDNRDSMETLPDGIQ